MKPNRNLIVLFIASLHIISLLLLSIGPTTTTTGELISLTFGIGSAIAGFAGFAGLNYAKCKFYECCDFDESTDNGQNRWVKNQAKGLRSALQSRLYGQHLVIETVSNAINAHLTNPNPKKALTLSFHGWTGGGKNFVSSIIAENMFLKGVKSSYYHLLVASHLFPHAELSKEYQASISNWIRGNVTQCARSLFVFDELDKMEPSVMEAIKPFINYYDQFHGVDFRKSIFIFLSNTGGNDITNYVFQKWQQHEDREKLTLKEMEDIINSAAFNEDGGLRYSSLISNHLIDHFIPFLPLEPEHVKLCIRDYFRDSKSYFPNKQEIAAVAAELQFFPKGIGAFSSSGCKRVAQKVELYMETFRQKTLSDKEGRENDRNEL